MSTTALRRPHYTALAVAATLGILYLSFRSYQSTEKRHPVGLQRSNAVRHSDRPSRFRTSTGLNADALATHLQQARSGSLGRYQNEVLFPYVEGIDQISLDLSAANLTALRDALISHSAQWPHGWSREAEEALEDHISGQFVYNFLNEAVDTWTLSPSSVRLLVSMLKDLGIHPRVTYRILVLGQGGNLQPDAWTFDPTEVITAPPPFDGADHEDGDSVYRPDGDEEDSGEPIRVQNEEWDDTSGSADMLGILYSISRDQARRDAYLHRGIECNSCGACPILGVRYHCSNCFDYDLCEICEANQVHVKSHVFYKIRIPAPSRGPIKQVLPKWYPGNPNAFPTNLPRMVLDRLRGDTGMDISEIEALYDQFKCLGGARYPDDRCDIGMAIDRKGFDLYFIPGDSDKPGPSNLIYDRIFAFYDRNGDDLIDFQEFVLGLSDLQNKSRMARLRRIFFGYDLDGDGYVSRRDFLRVFRAYYDLSRQLNREMMANQEEFGCLEEEIREVVDGSQPLSAAFGGSTFYGHQSRTGLDKHQAANGDLLISSGPHDVLQNDQAMHGDRERAIGNVAVGHRPRAHLFRTFRQDPPQDEQLMYLPMPNNFELLGIQHADDATDADLNGPDPPHQAYGWPPLLSPEVPDIVNALGGYVPVEEINDPVDRSRVIFAQSQRLDVGTDQLLEWQREKAVNERWKRRQFYLDEEEGMTRPVTYADSDVSDEGYPQPGLKAMAGSRSQSLRSRSSSKVRFDDSAIDTDYDTRSNASSRGLPVNERWGGYELSNPGVDVGQDILYQAIQQGFNKLLDDLFLEQEDKAMEAQASKKAREQFRELFDQHKQAIREGVEAVDKKDLLNTDQDPGKEAGEPDEDPGHPDPDPDPDPFIEDQGEWALANSNHISLEAHIFGNQIEVDLAQALEERKLAAALTDSKKDAASGGDGLDPTLPQNMPNEWDIDASGRVRKRTAPPSRETLGKWVLHEATEREIKIRGGPGRLSFEEFRWKMRQKNEMANAAAKPSSSTPPSPEEHGYWEESADLGKLSFIGTWLEISSF
ncbi:hypothetical protein DV735_g5482, partial [Chaetothyriales sp. CBS 134920]